MPDLAVHALLTGVVIRPFRRLARYLGPALLGSILPDLISRPVKMMHPALLDLGQGLHAPLIVMALAAALALAYPPGHRVGIAAAIGIAGLAHQAIDLLQDPVGPGYPLLFPLSWQTFPQGPLHPEGSLLALPLLAAAAVVVWWRWGRGAV